MDIRKWGLNKIMQLPDSCFGSRWPIIFAQELLGSATGYYISEIALPERSVIWQLFVHVPGVGGMALSTLAVHFNYKLGDQTPTAANFGAMEPLFKGIDYLIAGEKLLKPFSGVLSFRQPVVASGRRVCLAVENFETVLMPFTTGIVVSSVPNEVPDCLISA